jgi:signal peptidase II
MKKGSIVPWLLGVTLPLYVIDQITKFWTIGRFAEPEADPRYAGGYSFQTPDPPIEVIEGYFRLTRVHNQGVAFGMGNGTEWAPLVFPCISVVAFVLIWLGLRKSFFAGKAGLLAVALLLCGIIGNLTDRFIQGGILERMEGAGAWEKFKAGYVVDFLDVTIPIINYNWPVFNVADSCICVAATLLFISGWREERENKDGASGATG